VSTCPVAVGFTGGEGYAGAVGCFTLARGVSVGGMDVSVGGTRVLVAWIDVSVVGIRVFVAGIRVFVATMGMSVVASCGVSTCGVLNLRFCIGIGGIGDR